MELAYVTSSDGIIVIDNDTGDVIKDERKGDYGDIICFDLDEYYGYWNEDKTTNYDILDLSGWNKDGSYFQAEEEFREGIKRENNGGSK